MPDVTPSHRPPSLLPDASADTLGRGDLLPQVSAPLLGPRGASLVDALAASECPGLTARRARRAEVSGASHDPIVFHAARGTNVLDVDGNRYVDLVGGFGAALLGHAHPRIVDAVRAQSGRLLHALGDVYPSEEKVRLESRLAAMAPWRARVILGLSGADAVEAALKSARLATGRPGVLAFDGGYHGLSYGALAACGYKQSFRDPFEGQLNPAVRFAPYPDGDARARARSLDAVEAALRDRSVGAVLVEPILGRGGVVVPPEGFLSRVGELTRAAGALLIVDEIYTGLGRVGPMFRSVADGATPDMICLGKALGGSLPVSACLLREEVAACWAGAQGEAIHTSTFLGNPLACAAALASLDVLEEPETRLRIASAAGALHRALDRVAFSLPREEISVSGAGLLVGVSLRGGGARVLALVRALLERGFLTLPGGPAAERITLTPPMTLTSAQADAFGNALRESLSAVPAGDAP
jgi:4-aminobutyrate aminotransferase/(S)-3-amino-2-methylpropionate transaminase